MNPDTHAELEELAETVEAFYEDATRFRMVVEQYEQGNVSAERVEQTYHRAERSMTEADDSIGALLEGYAAGRMDQAMRDPGEERAEDRSAAAIAESIDATYLEAVDVYYDALHAYQK